MLGTDWKEQGGDYDDNACVLQLLCQGADRTSIQDVKWEVVVLMEDLQEIVLRKT